MSTAILAQPVAPPTYSTQNRIMAEPNSYHPAASTSANVMVNGSPAASPPTNPQKVRRQRPDTEEIRRVGRIHYQELLNFLRSHLAKEQTGPRSNAREKLTRLSKQQFSELSTDVYDELMRRINNAKRNSAQPHLAVREEFHPKRNQARQKLATLPKTRFKDLSSDVFFELERRFPELKEQFRPEVVAREKEAAAQAEREAQQQAEKANDISAAAQESTSDVIIPAKSSLVEEDIAVPYKNGRPGHDTDEEDGRSARESYDNRSTMYSQASSVGTGFFNGYAGSRATASNASPNLDRGSHADGFPNVFGIEKLKSDYEFRIATLQQRIQTLEAQNAELQEHTSRGDGQQQQRLQEAVAELDRLRGEHAGDLNRLEAQLKRHRDDHDAKSRELSDTTRHLEDAQRELEDLRLGGGGAGGDYERLQAEVADQEQIVQDLRAEVESLVHEVQQLSGRNEELVAEKDQDLVVIRDLNQQVQTFKRKYDQAKTELRQYKATSQLYVVQQPKAEELMLPSPNGVISDVNVTAFQTSIDELLSAARSTTPSNALIAMKSVVLATTLVTDDIAKFEQSSSNQLSPEDSDSLMQLKPKISTSLNNLMTACRNHASSHGMSPVSLLDAAASHVSMTVVELVKLLKVRSATQAEKDQFEAHFASANGGVAPNGLKPLHIGSLANSGKSPTFSPTLDSGSEWKPKGEKLGTIDTTASNKLSPRAPKTPQSPYGRYSPVGYRNGSGVTARKESAGSWKAGKNTANGSSHGVNRAASGSSVSSSNGAGLATLPRTDMSAVKHQWSSPSSRITSGGGGGGRRGGSPRTSGSFESQRQNTGDSNGGQLSRSSSSDLFANGTNGHGVRAPPLPRLSSQENGLGGLGRGQDDSSEENWAELQNYIEVQTEAIVHCIQALLSAIREGAQGVQLNENLVQITTIASSIVAISRDNLPYHSRSEGEDILNELTDNCDRLAEMQASSTFDKSTKSAMASASYGVAKGLKALNSLLNNEGSNGNGGGAGSYEDEDDLDLS